MTTERSVVVGRDGRAKAYRPLPAPTRAAAIEAGLAAYDRGDFFEAHEELEPAWMGTDDPAARSLLQGLIKVAAAYVHDVRGNPPGIVRNLEGARVLLEQAREGGPSDEVPGLDVTVLISAIDARLADLAAHPEGPTLGPPDLRPDPDPKERPVTMPAPIPTVDVTEAERRLRDDPDGPILLDVREPNEFAEVRAPGAVLVPTSQFSARVGELPADRPILVICAMGGRSAAVTGFLVRAGRTDVVNVAGGMDAWERAGLPVKRGPVAAGEGELPAG